MQPGIRICKLQIVMSGVVFFCNFLSRSLPSLLQPQKKQLTQSPAITVPSPVAFLDCWYSGVRFSFSQIRYLLTQTHNCKWRSRNYFMRLRYTLLTILKPSCIYLRVFVID